MFVLNFNTVNVKIAKGKGERLETFKNGNISCNALQTKNKLKKISFL